MQSLREATTGTSSWQKIKCAFDCTGRDTEMSKKRSALSHEDEQEIITHIRDAKNKKEQVQIEAELHSTSPEIVKDILREAGWNLRCLNGGSRKKKSIKGITVGLGDDNVSERWTPAAGENSTSSIKSIGENIKDCREKLNISADKLAELIGINKATIYRYENNEISKIPISVLSNISKALNICLNDLIGEHNSEEFVEQDIITPVENIEAAEGSAAETQQAEELSPAYIKMLVRERKNHLERIEEIDVKLKHYAMACKSILIDIKDGGLNV